MICASTSLRDLLTTSSMRPGWMRPSDTSFSSASRAISRRTGSKHDTTTVSGVSSMMTSTPVASSNARMLRPSRPMMRPFISSFGSDTAETVVSAVWSAAMRWMASATIFFASRSAFRLARLADLANPVGGVGLRLFFHPPDAARSWRPAPTCRPSARAGGAPRRPASPAPARARRRSFHVGRSRSRACPALCRAVRAPRTSGRARCRAPETRRSSRSTSSRRPRTSFSKFSRRRMTSSLPETTAVLRRFSASRSASPTIRFAVSSAVALASAWRWRSAPRPLDRPEMKKAGAAIMRVPSAAMIAYTFIWNLCSTAGWAADAGEPRLSRQRTLGMRSESGATPTKGITWVPLNTERAWTYGPARLVRAKLLAVLAAKGNEAAPARDDRRLAVRALRRRKQRPYEFTQVA